MVEYELHFELLGERENEAASLLRWVADATNAHRVRPTYLEAGHVIAAVHNLRLHDVSSCLIAHQDVGTSHLGAIGRPHGAPDGCRRHRLRTKRRVGNYREED